MKATLPSSDELKTSSPLLELMTPRRREMINSASDVPTVTPIPNRSPALHTPGYDLAGGRKVLDCQPTVPIAMVTTRRSRRPFQRVVLHSRSSDQASQQRCAQKFQSIPSHQILVGFPISTFPARTLSRADRSQVMPQFPAMRSLSLVPDVFTPYSELAK